MYKDLSFTPAEVAELFDQNVVLATGPRTGSIGRLEQGLAALKSGEVSATELPPIISYVRALNDLRARSGGISSYADEMAMMREFGDSLNEVAETLGLPEDHYSIDTSGEPIIVQEGHGEHVILPTHMEKGAYFNDPHADHQLDYTAEQLPRIQIGRYTRIGNNVGINAGGNVNIGSGAWLAPKSYLLLQNHSGYGRPAVGARSGAMTELPGITIGDNAWIGKESVVGWDTDYVGTGAVVATRSFVNGYVGDYSLTGDRGRIVQYFPWKAAAYENMGISFEDGLKISDWEAVQRRWLEGYRAYMREQECREPLTSVRTAIETLQGRKRAAVLDMHPGIGNNVVIASASGLAVDAVAPSRALFGVILQRVTDQGKPTVRLRGDVQGSVLPFKDARNDRLKGKQAGYDLVLDTGLPAGMDPEVLAERLREAARVTAAGGEILVSSCGDIDDRSLIEAGRECDLAFVRAHDERDQAAEEANTLHFRKG